MLRWQCHKILKGGHREINARVKDSILVEELKMLNRGLRIGGKDGQESAW